MKKLIISVLIVTGLFTSLYGQGQTKKPSMSFNETVHDFGKIKEADGTVSTTFSFTNTGSQPVIIGRVNASCGCTTPTWTKKPIVPGGKGMIKAAFDPRNRPGNFNKSITVYSNALESPIILRIKGQVEPKPKAIEDIYRHQMGPLRLKTNHAAFTRVYNTQTKKETVDVVNTSGSPITLSFTRVPKHVTIKAEPEKLAANEKGKLVLTYDASKKNDWGYSRDRLFIDINDQYNAAHRLYVSANIQEDFSGMSDAEKARAAKASFDNKTFNFGTLKQGEKVSHNFVLENKGKSDLKIRKIAASCGCTATSPDKRTIAPGEKATIKATFDSRGKSGRQNKAITVITNDPDNSKIILWIKGTVNK